MPILEIKNLIKKYHTKKTGAVCTCFFTEKNLI